MDTFPFHRNYTRQTSGMAVNHEAAGFVNSTVQWYSQSHQFLSYQLFPKKPPAGTTPRGHSPIDGFMIGMVERWNSTSQIMECLVAVGKNPPLRKPSPLQEYKVFAWRFLIRRGVHRKMVITRMYLRVR